MAVEELDRDEEYPDGYPLEDDEGDWDEEDCEEPEDEENDED